MSNLEEPTKRQRILIVTSDVLGDKMAGPGIRAWEMAKALHRVAEVRLVSNESATLQSTEFPVLSVDDFTLRPHVEWADVLVFHGGILSTHPWISATDTIIVADVYDPIHLEALELGKDLSPDDRENLVYSCEEALNSQLRRADFILCASEKQRDFWLGHIGALGRIRPRAYDADLSLRKLIDVAPFGVSESQPVQTRNAIKGSVPGIQESDLVILWGGGIYNWFDPLTLIRAVAKLAEKRTDIKLYFLGVKHPNPNVPTMQMATATMRLSDELGLTDRVVFFNTGWVDYEDRINYLLDADLGVSTHFEHVETAFSFRTRILDYLWAGLPIVATDGDTFAPIIRDRGLGTVVPPEDVDALANALEFELAPDRRDKVSERVRSFGEELTWSKALRPLVSFCLTPFHAADFAGEGSSTRGKSPSRLHIDSLEGTVVALQAEISDLRGSSSWKLTAPLRRIRTGARERSDQD